MGMLHALPIGGEPANGLCSTLDAGWAAQYGEDHVRADQSAYPATGAVAGTLVQSDKMITTGIERRSKVEYVLRAGMNTQCAAFTAILLNDNGSLGHTLSFEQLAAGS